MKINKIQINSYGKLKNIKMELNEGINIIYGNNEAGKSTLLNYITNSLYGMSKNKKGKEISDYEKYNPWIGEEFSGKLKYQLDNQKQYEIIRDFRRKNLKILDEKMSDITKEFNIDKTKGNKFFYEQTNIDEELFKSTFLVNQQEVKLNNSNQHMLIQKISNLVQTGQDNVSYKLAMDRLNRKQLDEIGTKRSREKPINVLEREIEKLENEKQEIEQYKDTKYEIEENKNEIQKEIDEIESKILVAREVRKIKDKEFIENEKIKLQENLEKENNKKINELKNEKEKIEKDENNILEKNKNIKNKIKKLNKKIIIILFILITLNVLQFIFLKNKYLNYIFSLTVPTVLIFYVFYKNRIKNKINNNQIEEMLEQKNKIENELNILEKNNDTIKNEIKKIKEKNNLLNNLEKEKIKNKNTKINKIEINNLINEENIENKIYNLQNLLNQNNLKIHKLELDKENIEPKLDNLSKLEERLMNLKERYVDIKNKEKSIEIAKEVLTSSYEKIKQEIAPKFTKQLSENIGIITKGAYSKAICKEEEGLIVELNNGDYVNANKLSIGTIDQLYLSLRLSMIDDLSQEKLPIFLDESFAYYDNDRLKNILLYLSENLKNRQIIIFTCTNREKNILEENKIQFQFIDMNNKSINI